MKEKFVKIVERADIKEISLPTLAMVPDWVVKGKERVWVDAGDKSTANGEYTEPLFDDDIIIASANGPSEYSEEKDSYGVVPMLKLNNPHEPGSGFKLNWHGFHVTEDPYIAVCDTAVTTDVYYLLYHGKTCSVQSSNITAWLHGWLEDQLEAQEE